MKDTTAVVAGKVQWRKYIVHTLLTLIPTLRGDLEEDRAHALTDYPDKRCLLQQQQKQNQQRVRDTATIAAQKFTVLKVHSATQMYGEDFPDIRRSCQSLVQQRVYVNSDAMLLFQVHKGMGSVNLDL